MEADQPPESPGQTRREPLDDPPGATRHEGRRAQPSPKPLTRLPATLARQYQVVRELPAQGAEADVLLASDKAGAHVVVKIFRHGFGMDPAVRQKLAGLSSPHLVRTRQTGQGGGRDYEVMEYLPGGNLRVLSGSGQPLGSEAVTGLVRQLHEGITCLHAAGIVHRDLKPENVLIRMADPLELAITDFGLSRTIDESVRFASTSRTPAYAAPESLSGEVSPARDWWSLGMIVLELATDRRAFEDMTEIAVTHHLLTRPIDTSGVTEPRIRLLCRGLLTRDPRRRWAAEQVTAWLSGESPAVAEEADVPRAGELTGLAFRGKTYTDRRALALALIDGWFVAASRFFSVMQTPSGRPSEAWRRLRKWLAQFNDPQRDDVEGLVEILVGDATADVKLLHLIAWLDPSLPPHFLGHRVAAENLPRIAEAAADPTSPDSDAAAHLGLALWEQQPLPVLASFADEDELADVDIRWRELARQWNALADRLRPDVPSELSGLLPVVPEDGEPPGLVLDLLALAADRTNKHARLAAVAGQARDAVTGAVPWFEMVSAVTDDPLRLLAVTLLAPRAAAEAERLARERDREERAVAQREREWLRQEEKRLAGRDKAVSRAIHACLLLIPLLAFEALVAGALLPGSGSGKTWTFTLLLVAGVIAWLVEAKAEQGLARQQGTDYLPHDPWALLAPITDRAGRALHSAGRTISAAAAEPAGAGCAGCGGCLLITVVWAVVITLITLLHELMGVALIVCLVLTPVVHTTKIRGRRHAWQESHASQEREANEIPGGS
jgi:eukaryotic-like serine/threonine-protein kinase